MAGEVEITVRLDGDLAARLRAAAAARGWSPESLIVDCVAQHLEVAVRHRVVLERMEAIDAAILDMARAVGELDAASGGLDLSGVCRYRKGGGGA